MKKVIQGVLLLAGGVGLYGQTGLAVVVNSANVTSNLSKAQLCKMILGGQPKWPGGDKVTVVLPTVGSPERAAILRGVCDMSEAEMNQHILHASFNGEQNTAARALPLAAIRSVVSAIPGALGFVPAASVSGAIKAVKLDGVGVGEGGYKIK